MKNNAPKIFVLLCLIGLTVILYLRTSRPWEEPGAGGGMPAQGAPGPAGQGPPLDAFFQEVAALEQALEENPDDTVSLARMGQLMVDSHQTAQAIDFLQRYLALSPESEDAQLRLANAYAGEARWQEARDLLEGFVERWPDNHVALFNLGAVYANLEEPDEAIALWERVQGEASDSVLVTMAEEALSVIR
jgi:tetratricopeptide (TPR) repeat protein